MRYPGLLKTGSKGIGVRQLQRRLLGLGYQFLGPGKKNLTADGVFGPITGEAVCKFQMQNADSEGNPLLVDGKVGILTWEALFEESETGFMVSQPRKTKRAQFMVATLEVAGNQVGIREIPKNSNRGPEVEQYLTSVGLGAGHAWCAAFVYWCARETAREAEREKVPLVKTAWTPSIWNWAKKRGGGLLPGEVLGRKKKLDPGCLFLLHGRVNGRTRVKHVGFVTGVRGGMVETIEGNINKRDSREGGGVYRLARKINSIYRFVNYG